MCEGRKIYKKLFYEKDIDDFNKTISKFPNLIIVKNLEVLRNIRAKK